LKYSLYKGIIILFDILRVIDIEKQIPFRAVLRR